MQSQFEVIRIDDPRVINLKMEMIGNEEICQFNSARIYKLRDGKYLLIPRTLGYYVILYYDKSILDQHIKNEKFPVGDYETDSYYEPENEIMSNINNNIEIYTNYVEKRFDIHHYIYGIDSTYLYLKNLNAKINNFGIEKLKRYDILAIGMYVNEIFRQNTGMNWKIEKVFTLNTYWVPSLVSDKGEKYNLGDFIYNAYYEYNIIDLDLSYKISEDKFKGNSPITGY